MPESTSPAWRLDPCPWPPLVLAGELALPPGASCDAPRLVADVHVTRAPVTPADRARALALCSPAGHGVLVRSCAAWVWSGHPDLLPRQLDLALPTDGPPLPGPRPGRRRRGLPVRVTRWDGPRTWVRLSGVPLSDPEATATDCARLLPQPLARVCVQALARSPGLDVDRVVMALLGGGRLPGRRQALGLLHELREPHELRDRHEPGQFSETSRCTPLVTR